MGVQEQLSAPSCERKEGQNILDLWCSFVLCIVGKGGWSTEYTFLQYTDHIEFIDYAEELRIYSRLRQGTNLDVCHRRGGTDGARGSKWKNFGDWIGVNSFVGMRIFVPVVRCDCDTSPLISALYLSHQRFCINRFHVL